MFNPFVLLNNYASLNNFTALLTQEKTLPEKNMNITKLFQLYRTGTNKRVSLAESSQARTVKMLTSVQCFCSRPKRSADTPKCLD